MEKRYSGKNFQRLCELAHASSEIEEYEIPLLVQYETRYGEKEKTIDGKF